MECRGFWLFFQTQTCLCENEDGLEVNVGRLSGRVEERGFGPGLGGGELPASSSQSLKLAGERRGSHGAWLSVNQQSTLITTTWENECNKLDGRCVWSMMMILSVANNSRPNLLPNLCLSVCLFASWVAVEELILRLGLNSKRCDARNLAAAAASQGPDWLNERPVS